MVEVSDYIEDYLESWDSFCEDRVCGGGVSRLCPDRLFGCAVAPSALLWRVGCVAWLRCEVVLDSGRVVVSSVPASSVRSACFRARAAVSGSGVLCSSLFLSDGRWVCSALA